MARGGSRFFRWAAAVFFSALLHVFFLKNIVVVLPMLREELNPEIVFLGSILISPDVQGEWPAVGERVDQTILSMVDSGLNKKASRFFRATSEKPLSVREKKKGPVNNPEKTIFPLEDAVYQKEPEEKAIFKIPKEPYQPLRLEFHDPR